MRSIWHGGWHEGMLVLAAGSFAWLLHMAGMIVAPRGVRDFRFESGCECGRRFSLSSNDIARRYGKTSRSCRSSSVLDGVGQPTASPTSS